MVLFAAVVREGGFTRAARQLGVTKQTVSERISKLEERLGVRLLERTTRRLRVTDTGALYYERCAAIAAQIEEANNAVLERRAEPVGLLRVSAPTLYGRYFLAPVIAATLARYPKLRLEVVLAERRVDLIEEGFDLAIRIGLMEDSSLAARKLGDGHVYLVASPRLLRAGGALTPAALRDLPAVGVRSRETWTVQGMQMKIEPRLVVNDHAVACEAAIAGLGVAFLPSLVCQEAVLDGRLEILFGPEPAMQRPVFAVFPSRRYVPPKVRVFLEALTTMIAPMAPIVVPPRRRRTPSRRHDTRAPSR
jgi:DNA-binding transcriptional LysR family regulator